MIRLLFRFKKLIDFKEKEIFERQRRAAPKGKSESPWGLHIGSFWEIHFINPPEVQGKILGQ